MIVVADNTSYDLLGRVVPALFVSFGAGLPLASAAAWAIAFRRRLATPRALFLTASLFVGATVFLLLELPMLGAELGVGEPWPFWLRLAAPGLAAAIVLPHGLAPLALRWNRHR